MKWEVWLAQKMWPQCRQWCLRVKMLKALRQVGESQVGEAESGCGGGEDVSDGWHMSELEVDVQIG